MEETFTLHQVRKVLAEMHDDVQVEMLLQEMRETPQSPGALGFTDDELKGAARDAS